MIARKMTTEDWKYVPPFRAQYEFDWKFPSHSERVASACVIEDVSGIPLALCAAELIPSVTLAINQNAHPSVRLRAGALIHEYLKQSLAEYPELHCEVPPSLERAYGRHLEQIFGWQQMWKGYKLRKTQ